ncbi:putative metallo-dependent phosphatase [Klebsiella phage KPN8]|nr:putative metallo-dependent phosphatase [Klebsiella phage KPN8]
MTARYFAGDFHLGDPSIIKYRKQFKTVKEHDEFIADTILVKPRDHDILTIVGDGFIKPESLFILKKFPYKKHLIPGNHCMEKGVKVTDLAAFFDVVTGSFKWKSGFFVSHEPQHPDHLRGRINIHAHLHDKVIEDERYIGVSLEQTGYRLIHHDEILSGSYRTYRAPRLEDHLHVGK